MKVLDAVLPAPRDPVVPQTTLRAASAIALAWLIGQPHRLGNRLFAMNDAEAGWRGWQVSELAAGLGRRYRDARFGTPRGPADRS